MSDAAQADGGMGSSEPGILAALPRTRPQRASPRRAATRKPPVESAARPSTGGATEPSPTRARRPRPASPRPKPSPKARPKRREQPPGEPPAPRQGYEPEEEIELGKAVNPPSGAELVESIADIFADLAGEGLSVGGRLLRDALSTLRRP